MSKEATPTFAIPPEMRAVAEQSVEQAKTAFNTFINAAHDAVSRIDSQAKVAQAGVQGVNDKAVSYAERNVAAAFEFAQKVVRAGSVQDVVKLQTEFVQSQMQALAEQAKELGETAAKTLMGGGAKPPS
jgi:phasin